MTRNFAKWEVDPLFAAAEEVQDSADRLDSAYRTWIHCKSSLFDGEGEHLIEFRKRELRTALGTAKWQLEEFEKVVHTAQPQYHHYEEEDAPGRHKQFISAIQNQIATIEDALLSSNDARDLKALSIVRPGHENEKDELEQFLCGSRDMESMPTTSKGLEKIDWGLSSSSSQGSVQGKLRTSEQIISSSSHALGFLDYQMPADWVQMRDDHNVRTLSHSDSEILVTDQNDDAHTHQRSISIGDDLSYLQRGTSNLSAKRRGNIFAAGINKSAVLALLSKMKHTFQLPASRSGFKRWKDGDSLVYDQYQSAGRFSNEKEAGNIGEQSNASLKKHGIQSKAWGGTFGTLQYSQNLMIGRQLARIGSLILAAFVLGFLSFHVIPKALSKR